MIFCHKNLSMDYTREDKVENSLLINNFIISYPSLIDGSLFSHYAN